MGGQWLRWLLLAVVLASPAADVRLAAQTAGRDFSRVARRASRSDVHRQGSHCRADDRAGHPRVRAALTALLEDRLYIRTDDNKIFIVKTTEGEPPGLCARRSGLGSRRRRGAARYPGEDRQQQQAPAIAADHARAFRALEPRSGGATRRDPGHAEIARRADRRAPARAQGRRDRSGCPDSDRHGSRDGRPRRNGLRRTACGHRGVVDPPWIGRPQQARVAGGEVLRRHVRRSR